MLTSHKVKFRFEPKTEFIVVKMRLQLFNFLIVFTLANESAAEPTREKPRNSGQCNAQPECLVFGFQFNYRAISYSLYHSWTMIHSLYLITDSVIHGPLSLIIVWSRKKRIQKILVLAVMNGSDLVIGNGQNKIAKLIGKLLFQILEVYQVRSLILSMDVLCLDWWKVTCGVTLESIL